MSYRFHVYCCARSTGGDRERLAVDLLRSPEIHNGNIDCTILWDQASASCAYLQATEGATAEVLIFAHCDVYFPKGWFERLEWEVTRLEQLDPNWAVAGIASLTPSGVFVGRVFDTALGPLFPETSGLFGKSLIMPVPIVSTDELVLIVRRESGTSFDPHLPEFHLYGTDIVLEAEREGKGAYGLDMPVIHNAKAHLKVGSDYKRAFRYMVRKWRGRLPVPTTCGPLTAAPFALTINAMRQRYYAIRNPWAYSVDRLADPGVKALELNLETMLTAPMGRE